MSSLFRNPFALRTSARPVAKPERIAPTAMFRLQASWKPDVPMQRVILHWTGGSYTASSLDKEHYHFVVEGDGTVLRGNHSIADNVSISGKTSDEYAAHTKGCNTGSIGVSMCAMASAVEAPFDAGKYPLTEKQWKRAAELIADLCRTYRIPVTAKTVLTHAEVQKNLGIKQNGKWDIARLPFDESIVGATACGDNLRIRVLQAM